MVEKLVNGNKTRIAIDTAMILAMATLLWNVSGWFKEINISMTSIRSNQSSLMMRMSTLEANYPNLPITREAERRITAIETLQQAQYKEIIDRLDRWERYIINEGGPARKK